MTQMVRVHNFGVSSDGYAAGEGQSLERPFGHRSTASDAALPNASDASSPRGMTTVEPWKALWPHWHWWGEARGHRAECGSTCSRRLEKALFLHFTLRWPCS